METLPSNNQSKALLAVSQSEFSSAIKEGRFSEASKMMPTTIAKAIEQPKVFEMIQAIGENSILNQIEFELVNLNLLMSVGGKLTDNMVSFVAKQLLNMYPNESIADFKLCFERGAMGIYGSIQRLDGITIGEWMVKYLDEKYEVMETELQKQKTITFTQPENTEMSEETKKLVQDYINSLSDFQKVPKLDADYIRANGQQSPPCKRSISAGHKFDSEAIILADLRTIWAREKGNGITDLSFDEWLKL